MNLRLPAEWEEQDGVLLGWPHEETDWNDCLEDVLPVFIQIAGKISKFEKVIIPAPDPEKVSQILTKNNIDLSNIRIYPIKTNDTWARDYGFITLYENRNPVLLDFGFNGWGLKFASNFDNQISYQLTQVPGFTNAPLKTMSLILEGGSIESDGEGTVLTTSECLLSRNRNPHFSKEDIQKELMRIFQVKKVLWLDHGYLAGDDTDSHIDTLARLCPDNTILYVSCDDEKDEHFAAIKAMEEQLKTFTAGDGNKFTLIPLPFPKIRLDDHGDRMPATYANFLITNKAVLVPTYDDPQDQPALDIIKKAFPGREVIGINCLPLIRQHGSLHCVTMQIPKGVLL